MVANGAHCAYPVNSHTTSTYRLSPVLRALAHTLPVAAQVVFPSPRWCWSPRWCFAAQVLVAAQVFFSPRWCLSPRWCFAALVLVAALVCRRAGASRRAGVFAVLVLVAAQVLYDLVNKLAMSCHVTGDVLAAAHTEVCVDFWCGLRKATTKWRELRRPAETGAKWKESPARVIFSRSLC